MPRARLETPAPEETERLSQGRFAEIVPAMAPEEASREADRCLYCYDAPCIRACPTHIEVPRFIKQIAARDLLGAAKTILEANPLGHSCARVCPVPVLCEGACVYLRWQKAPIRIARLQRHATDFFYKLASSYRRRLRSFKPGPDNGRRVAVIGAGPAGLSCAWYLRRLGHPVTVFEKADLPGGLNATGIAEYKMTRPVALEEARFLLDLGAQVRLGIEAGKDVALDALERGFEAVFVAVGLGETRPLRVPGERLPGVWDALTFIAHIKERRLKPLGRSRVTVVIGGGNTAIDVVTQARRLGAEKVVMAYRRGRREMPAYGYEFELAKSEEAEFLWNAAPVAVLGDDRVAGVRFARTRIGNGAVENIPGTEFEVPCDRVIKALGQTQRYSLAKQAGLELDDSGRLKADPETLRTSDPRYWAGGDAINGGKEVVNAAADGKRAAWSIHRALTRTRRPPPAHAYWVDAIGPHV